MHFLCNIITPADAKVCRIVQFFFVFFVFFVFLVFLVSPVVLGRRADFGSPGTILVVAPRGVFMVTASGHPGPRWWLVDPRGLTILTILTILVVSGHPGSLFVGGGLGEGGGLV